MDDARPLARADTQRLTNSDMQRLTNSDMHSNLRPESFIGPSIKIQLREKETGSGAARGASTQNNPSVLTQGGVTPDGGSTLNFTNQVGPVDVIIAPKRRT